MASRRSKSAWMAGRLKANKRWGGGEVRRQLRRVRHVLVEAIRAQQEGVVRQHVEDQGVDEQRVAQADGAHQGVGGELRERGLA